MKKLEIIAKEFDKYFQEFSTEIYNCGYQQGLEDAWKCARKIACIRTDAEWKEFFEFLDVKLFHPEDIFTKYTASKAMQKIMDYEERQNEDKWQTLEGNIKKAIEPFKISDVEQVLEQMRKENE